MAKTIEEVIRERGFYVTVPKGTSMYPLLIGGKHDICIVKADEIEKYDVALYRRESGENVLHRVLDIDSDGYVCCGDNQWVLERGVKREQIIGKLDNWHKGNKEYTVRDKRYQRYVKFWCKSLKRRRRILRILYCIREIKFFVASVFRKLFGKKADKS